MILSSAMPVTNRAANFGHNISNAVAEHPILFTADAVDLGTSISNSLSLASGAGGNLLQGAGYAMGAYHAVNAVVSLCKGVDAFDGGCSGAGKYQMTNCVGHLLTATGNFCAAAGVGPVSLGFVGLGLLVENLNTVSN
jgi:hypothetical protein